MERDLDKEIQLVERKLMELRDERNKLGSKSFDFLVGKYFKCGNVRQQITKVDFINKLDETTLIDYSCITIKIDNEKKTYFIDTDDCDSISEDDIIHLEIQSHEFIEAMVDCYEQIKNKVL